MCAFRMFLYSLAKAQSAVLDDVRALLSTMDTTNNGPAQSNAMSANRLLSIVHHGDDALSFTSPLTQ